MEINIIELGKRIITLINQNIKGNMESFIIILIVITNEEDVMYPKSNKKEDNL